MAMSYVIRKTSPTMVPLALRAISISSARVVLPESGSFRSYQFSTAAVDKKLVKVLKSEIKSMRRTRSQVLKSLIESSDITIPADFPFKIEEKERCIILTRELPAENIKVTISKPRDLSKAESYTLIDRDSSIDDDESDTDSDNDSSSDTDNNDNSSSTDSMSDDEEEKEDDNDSSIEKSRVGVRLQVRIIKQDGSFMNMRVLGFADEIMVAHIEIYASPSPDGRVYFDYKFVRFTEFAPDVQNTILEFIGVRGIDKTNVEFWYKYMVRKFNNIQPDKINEHMRFLESFKEFVSQEIC